MRYSIFILLALAACTSDNYVPKDASQDVILHNCRKSTFKEYHDLHDNDSQTATVLGGVLLGPVGAIAGSQMSNNDVKKLDLNEIMRRCMLGFGYSGDSRGYN